jgi:hypothetical protein
LLEAPAEQTRFSRSYKGYFSGDAPSRTASVGVGISKRSRMTARAPASRLQNGQLRVAMAEPAMQAWRAEISTG